VCRNGVRIRDKNNVPLVGFKAGRLSLQPLGFCASRAHKTPTAGD